MRKRDKEREERESERERARERERESPHKILQCNEISGCDVMTLKAYLFALDILGHFSPIRFF